MGWPPHKNWNGLTLWITNTMDSQRIWMADIIGSQHYGWLMLWMYGKADGNGRLAWEDGGDVATINNDNNM